MGERDNQPKDGYSQKDWERHYETDDLHWDLGKAAPPFVRLWQEKNISPGNVIVPGCGRGHEVLFLAERGFQVTAVDFSRGAVEFLTTALAKRAFGGRVLHQDFFELDPEYDNSFDLLLEHTFFCAIGPAMRKQYVATAGRLLKSGSLLIGLFYETGEKDGPPFNTTRNDVVDNFFEQFTIETLDKTRHSAERRQGKEWLGILRRK